MEQAQKTELLVSNLCVDYLGSDNHLWINRAYPLDKGGDAIKAHILSDSDIEYIMSCTLMLKSELQLGFVVHRDYCQEVLGMCTLSRCVESRGGTCYGEATHALGVDWYLNKERDKVYMGKQYTYFGPSEKGS